MWYTFRTENEKHHYIGMMEGTFKQRNNGHVIISPRAVTKQNPIVGEDLVLQRAGIQDWIVRRGQWTPAAICAPLHPCVRVGETSNITLILLNSVRAWETSNITSILLNSVRVWETSNITSILLNSVRVWETSNITSILQNSVRVWETSNITLILLNSRKEIPTKFLLLSNDSNIWTLVLFHEWLLMETFSFVL